MRSSQFFLPVGTLPKLHFFPAGQTVEWLHPSEDSHELYRKRGGHPVYGVHDITYSFNSHGYRSAEFDTKADIRILAVGCSYVMGVGLRREDIFHEVFAARLRSTSGKSVAVLNLGVPGGSNDYIARVLHLTIPLLDPDMVLINFTHSGRREYISLQSELLTYVPACWPSSPVARNIYKHLAALTSPMDDLLNLFRNYKSIEALLKGRTWLFSSILSVDLDKIGEHIDQSRYVGGMAHLDKARDHCHPGPQSHGNLAGKYWERYVSNGH